MAQLADSAALVGDYPRPVWSSDAGVIVKPLTGFTGAVISGVDVSKPLTDEQTRLVRAAWLRWKVIFFRNQPLTHEQQIAFTERFGQTSSTTVLRGLPERFSNEPLTEGADQYPDVFPMLYEYPDKPDPQAAIREAQWHHDGTAYLNPPAGATFRASAGIRPYGGDTGFANLVAAYDGLPQVIKDLIDPLQAIHSTGPRFIGYNRSPELRRSLADYPRETVHPVVRVHPETGEKAIYVNRVFTQSIVGFSDFQSQSLLELLYEQIERPEYAARWHWHDYDLAFWDNRAALHIGPGDLRTLGHRKGDRLLYHVPLLGDIPVGADGRQSQQVLGEPGLPTPR